ncbi:MAG: hypothetical protein P8J70_12770 [Glaciecola sp.]|jgi:hypothetical protein|nr:hypothetical protein [Glaciecola sp.]MDG1815575.1 hypothetical protein [Glaciecola sp.]MDG2100533.1 hypothetical protein [Glaciecola sp.]
MEATSRLHQGFFRNGQSHRDGADVSFKDILKLFGFRTIEIGRWVSAEEQQIAANLFFDALYDLCDILQVPEQVISLKGRLAIAFGKGGRQGVCAHYTPAKHEISLAKNAGAGSLAHEWFHAFDHYIGQKMYRDAPSSMFASVGYLHHQPLIEHPLNVQLAECFTQILLSHDKSQPSEFFYQAKKLDEQFGGVYFTKPEELCARAFESLIQDNAITNHFLVSGTKQSTLAKAGAYPTGQTRLEINHQLLTYFSWLGQSLR